MFPQTFDQPFDLVIKSECSPVFYLLSNSPNEIRASFKSRVTVSIEHSPENVSGSSYLIPPEDSGTDRVDESVTISSKSDLNGSIDSKEIKGEGVNEDSESEIELDWDSAPTSSDPFTSSDDETVTKKQTKNFSQKTFSSNHDRQNFFDQKVNDDYLLRVMAGVHDKRSPEPSVNFCERKIDCIQRHVPCLEQNDDSDDDPFPFNRPSCLQPNKNDPSTPSQSVNTNFSPSLDSNSKNSDKNEKKSEERKVQRSKRKKRKRVSDKTTNRTNFKRRRLDFNLQLNLLKNKMTQLNKKFVRILKSANNYESETDKMPINNEPLTTSTCGSSNNTAEANRLTGRVKSTQTEISSLDPEVPKSYQTEKDGLNENKESTKSCTTKTSTSKRKKIIESIDEPETVKTNCRPREIETHKLVEFVDKPIKAVNEEKNRMKRLLKQEKKFNQFRFDLDEHQKRSILDFDENGKVRVEVDHLFLQKLRDQQDEGIKFMYNSTIENVDRLKEGDGGSGCILAHYKGLNKTFQAMAFVHTILSSSSTKEYIETVLIVVPDDTRVKWKQEFNEWMNLRRFKTFKVFELDKKNSIRFQIEKLNFWQVKGGVLIIEHTLFDRLCDKENSNIGLVRKYLIDPGPDLIIIDEGHSSNQLNKIVASMKTRRKILLTRTRLETNLDEYYTMIDIIKPRLLGTRKFFADNFQTPIEKGQKVEATSAEMQMMEDRLIILNQLLDGSLRMYYFATSGLTLQPKFEFALFIRPSKYVSKVYNYFVKRFRKEKHLSVHCGYLRLCVNHPGFYRKVHDNEEFQKHNLADSDSLEPDDTAYDKKWYKYSLFIASWDDYDYSCKFVMFFKILRKSISKGEKLVVASQSIETLDLIADHLWRFEYRFGSQNNRLEWDFGKHYFRIDRTVPVKERLEQIEKFNDPANKEARLFLLSTKAGGIATDLHGANRLIIFDVSLNPNDDIQAICRVYRMGQTKPVYVYRLITKDTMEEQLFRAHIDKLEMSIQSLDQQQDKRIFTPSELNEFYDVRPKDEYQIPDVTQPQSDSLLSELLSAKNKQVLKCIEFDSLLQKDSEDLNEIKFQLECNQNQESLQMIKELENFDELIPDGEYFYSDEDRKSDDADIRSLVSDFHEISGAACEVRSLP